MTSPGSKCPRCGARLSPDAIGGLCPACLLRRSLAASDAPEPEPQAVDAAVLEAAGFAPPRPADAGLRVCCPQCGRAIELAEGSALSDIRCDSCGTRFSIVDEQAATQTAATFGRVGQFEILDKLGTGAFGTVWKARDKRLDRLVAVKIPRRPHLKAEEAEKFLREARAAAQLRHPNIVSVFEVGRDEDLVYIVCDFVEGVSLADWLSGKRVTGREAARLCRKIALALQHAHEQGVIHRDIKPGNILLDAQGEPHLTDFGLARREAGEVTMTLDGQLLGTPAYMSPELARGEAHQADRRTDLYSLGVVLFQLLTGELPFRGNTRMLVHQVIHDDPPSPRKLNGQVPRDLETICLKCLEKEPAGRYESAQALGEELDRFLNGEPIEARPIGRAGKTWRWCRRKPALAAMTGAAVALLLTVALVSTVAAVRIAVARKAEQQEAYCSNIALADRYIKDGSINRALDLLYKCPAEFRHWEWGHLLYLCHQDIISIAVRTNIAGWRYLGADSPIRSLAFDVTGTRLGVHCTDGRVSVYHRTDGRELYKFGDANKWVMSWVFHPAGTELALGMTNGTVRILDTTTWQEKGVLRLEELPTKRARSSSAPSGSPTEGAGQPSIASITSLAYDSAGRRLAGATSDGRVKVWNFESGQELLIAADEAVAIEKIWFTPDGRQLVAQRQLAVRCLDAETGREVSTFRIDPVKYWAVYADPTGQHLATIDIQERVQLWSNGIPTHALGAMTLSHTNERRLFFSPDGQLVCTPGDQGTARLYQVATGKELFPIPERVHHVAFNAQGTRLVAAVEERMVKVWDIAQGQELLPLRGNLSLVDQMTFSPDGRLIAVASRDGVVRIWSSSPGRERYPVGHWTWADAYSRDGKRLSVVGAWDNLKIWDAESGRLELVLKSRTSAYPLDSSA